VSEAINVWRLAGRLCVWEMWGGRLSLRSSSTSYLGRLLDRALVLGRMMCLSLLPLLLSHEYAAQWRSNLGILVPYSWLGLSLSG
jgi:hypothetical protein